MSKKLLLLILALLMVCCLAACGGDAPEETKPTLNPGDPNCDHDWSDWDVTKEQTCSKNGRQKRLCETCGKEEQETILAWGHIYMDGKCVECDKEVKDCEHKETYALKLSEADCYVDGESRTVCKKCKAVVDQDFTAAYWHPEWDVVKVAEPTCTENGIEHLVCKLCQEVIGQNVIEPNGHDYLYVDGQKPTCTDEGWTDHRLCAVCDDLRDYYIMTALGHLFIADTCFQCGQVDSSCEMMDVPGIRDNQLVVEQTVLAPSDVIPAQVDSFTGDISTGEVLTFHASVDGGYMLWINKMEAGAYVQMEVFDMSGNRVAYGEEIYSDGGMYVELTEGDYTVKLSYGNALTTYHLCICHPRAAVDISGQAAIRDQMQYYDQVITYTYTAEAAGMYYFNLSDMTDQVYMELWDAYDNLLDINEYATAGNTMVAYLEAGETCTFYFENKYGYYGSFILNINTQRPALDITGYTSVTDSIRYAFEQVTYTFTAAETYYSIVLLDMKDNDYVSLYLYGPEGDLLYNSYWNPNGSSFYYDAFEVGQTYTIVVEQANGITGYTLGLLAPRDTVQIRRNVGVRDEMLYYGQVNDYQFTVEHTGTYSLVMDWRTGNSYNMVIVQIYDADGNWQSEHCIPEGVFVNLGYLQEGQTYTIRITQFVETMQYILFLQEI